MLRIDYKSGLPIYDQIYRGIVKMAAAGAFGGDGQLPSVRSVAQELGVNPNTVQKAYGLLERDGVICSLPGKGSFLTGDLKPLYNSFLSQICFNAHHSDSIKLSS